MTRKSNRLLLLGLLLVLQVFYIPTGFAVSLSKAKAKAHLHHSSSSTDDSTDGDPPNLLDALIADTDNSTVPLQLKDFNPQPVSDLKPDVFLARKAASSQNLKPKMPEYYGQGYNLITANPLAQSIDPGLQNRQVFSFTYNQGSTTTGQPYFYYPDQVTVTSQVACSGQSNSQTLTGMQSYQNSLNTKVSVSGSYSASKLASVSFSGSVAYQSQQQSLGTQQNVAVQTQMVCQLYQASLNQQQTLSNDFLASVAAAVKANSWTNFLNNWGFHYVTKVTLGVAAYLTTTFSRDTFQQMSALGIDVQAKVSAKYASFSGSVGVDTSTNTQQQSAYANSNAQSTENWIGIKPPTDGSLRTWVQGIGGDSPPAPLSVSLGYIGDLFTSDYFGNTYSDATLQQMQTSFKAAIDALLGSLTVPLLVDTPLFKGQVATLRTKVVGSFNTAPFADNANVPLGVKVSTITFQYGAWFDSIQVTLTNGVKNNKYGGPGGCSPQNLQLKDAVTSVTVFQQNPGSGITGMMFTYAGGGIDTIGQRAGTSTILPIYGDIVGVIGQQGQYVDAIGFVTRAYTFNANNRTVYPSYTLPIGSWGTGTPYEFNLLPSTQSSFYIQYGAWINAISADSRNWAGVPGGRVGSATVNVASVGNTFYVYADNKWTQGFYFPATNQRFGNTNAPVTTVSIPPYSTLVGIWGRSGLYVDCVGFIFGVSMQPIP